MAILGPSQLPALLKVDSNPLKLHALSELGHPNVLVEMTEVQWEQVLRSMGDFIANYFPLEHRLHIFYTTPLQTTYDLPPDAYWVRDVAWDPVSTRIDDIFGAESFLFNIGNVTGIQNMLLDYHMLLAYRKFSQKILATEGKWEFIPGEGDDMKSGERLRLYPTPKGRFPVMVLYIPEVVRFKTVEAREILYRAVVAKTKLAVGAVRRKISGMPAPDGGQLALDGDALISEGKEEYKEVVQDAIHHGEPMGPFAW